MLNRSDEPCTFPIFGTRIARDTVHYPGTGKTLRDEDGTWRLLTTEDGTLIGEGEIEQIRTMKEYGSGIEELE